MPETDSMKTSNWTKAIVALFLALSILGGAWVWDALDYPMPGIPEAPPTPFGYGNWDWDVPVVTNLSRIQARLRSKRYGRLRGKWLRELDFAGTYWTFWSGMYAIHFDGDGNVSVRKPAGSLPDPFEEFHSFERTHVKEIVLYSRSGGKGEATRIRLSAITEDSIMLVSSGGSPIAVLDRSPSSSKFDSLVNQETGLEEED